MSRILVIEVGREPGASALLASEGFTVLTACDRGEALECLASFRPELLLVEVDAPRGRAIDTCKVLRAATVAPIVMVSGQCPEREAVAAFAVGVDSLVLGPVGPHELVARLRALLRRLPPEPEDTGDVIVVGGIVLDRARRELRVRGELVPIPRREFDIAEILMREVGRVVPRAVIVRELWGSMRDTKSLDVQVGRLRARLAAAEGVRRIVTVRGLGFRFVGDDEREVDDVMVIDLVSDAADSCGEPAPA
ncbi:MAG TPA: response regulator transcription factor [Acidimicrobiia bacterium]|nr:response regulator transcription factor [Acidimicrobiia bacterium]